MHALITGASAGIGEGLARELSTAGYDLTLVARREAELSRVIGLLGAEGGRGKAVPLVADLGQLDQIDGVVARAADGLGPIDVLINNAGIQIVARTEDVSVADGERLLTLNVFAAFRLTQAVLPDMLARGSGTIVDISSLSALAPTPGMFHYSASKAALAAASESLRAEVKARGVHVVTVYPGPVKTAMAEAAIARYAKNPMVGLPLGNTAELARLIVAAIEKKRARVIYPRSYAVARMFPSLTRWVIDRFSPLPKSLKS